MTARSSRAPEPPTSPARLLIPGKGTKRRYILLSAVGLLELVALSVRVDTPEDGAGWIGLLANGDVVAKIGVVFLAAAGYQLLQLTATPTGIASDDHRWWAWLAAHLALFATFLTLAPQVMDAPSPAFPLAMFWLVLGSCSVATLVFCFAPPRALLGIVRRYYRLLLSSLVASVAAWLLGKALQQLWKPLSQATFWITHQILEMSGLDIDYSPELGIIGTDRFLVEIAPQCSGYEGIGLIVVFVSLYLVLFRKYIRLPHSLLLYPIGIAAIYIANALRLSALILVGHFSSAEDAVSGFHSQAGWTIFTALSLGLLALGRRCSFFHTLPRRRIETHLASRQASALLVPFLVLLGSGMLAATILPGSRLADAICVVATAAALWRFRASYRSLVWSWSWPSVAIGVAVFIVWMALVPGDPALDASRDAAIGEMPGWAIALWIAFRLVRSVLVVAIVEELAFRGFLLRKLVSRDFDSVPVGRLTFASLAISSALFGLLHPDWLAGTLAGAAYAIAQWQTRSVGGAIVAHGVTNALIAAVVLSQGHWSLWP